MNSDYDFSLNSGESSSTDEARNRFLDSLGLGEHALRSLDGDQAEGSKVDEGLVLSSQPDIEETEARVDLSNGRAISISANRGAVVNRSLEITMPASPKVVVAGDLEEKPSVAPGADDLDYVINLSCPECAGDLVIKRRHLGVEGACVWCHTPIVAAETARDRQIRVFPLLGSIQKGEVAGTPAAPESHDLIAVASATPWKPIDAKVEPSLPTKAEAESVEEVSPDPEVVPDLADGFYGGNMGFTPSFEDAAPEDVSAEENITKEVPTPMEPPVPMDLEDLYSSTGFGSPAAEKKSEPGFGETLTNTPEGSVAFNPAGFGAFLQSPDTISDRVSEDPPTPWSATVTPLISSPEPPVQAPTRQDESSPGPFRVSSPSPWGPPAKFVPDETMIDAPPTLIEEEPSLSDWASAFENHIDPVNPGTELNENASPEILTWGTSTSAGFDSAFAASMDKPTAIEAAEDTPTGFFSNTPTSKMLFGRSEPGAESFAMPGHYFSTGSSSEPEPSTFEALFTPPAEEESLSPIFEAAETGSPDGISTTLDQMGGDSLFPPNNQGPALFGDSSMVSFQNEPVTETSAPTAQGVAFSDLKPAPVSSDPGPVPTLPSFTVVNDQPASPSMASLPLGNKPKPKVRKGFMILMVIIVGFASGAALASFVLPVEEYVQTARAFMEKKFNPAAMTPQTLPLPTGTDAPAEITEP